MNLTLKIDILGTEYTITDKTKEEDPYLEKCDGYCDKSVKKIVISKKEDDCELANFKWYRRKIMRHEIIHAFLFESGLHENWHHDEYGHDETVVDWIAVQFPKLMEVFKVAGCLEN